MLPSEQATRAAEDIFLKYEKYLGATHMGNQDKNCCVQTIAEIISHHCDKPPRYLSEALNSGDGAYKP